MRSLSAREIVQVWEWGQDRHPVDRALLLLVLSQPEMTPQEVAALTIGQRNARLLTLREMTLGPELEASVSCPQCGAPLGFSVTASALRRPEPNPGPYTLESDGYHVEYRLPDSTDMAALAGLADPSAARRILTDRCVLCVEREGAEVAVAELPESIGAALAEAIGDNDLGAETRLRLNCADCGYSWPALFDIVAFFWAEINSLARRLLQDVAALARAYGWRETDILAMSAPRREYYLELAA